MGLCHASIRSNFGSGLIACLSRPATRWRRCAVDAVATDIDAVLTHFTKKASRESDKDDESAVVAGVEKGLDKAANIAGE